MVAVLAACLGFAASFEGLVGDVSRFLFFLFTALFVILGLTHLFIGGDFRFRR